MLRNALLVAACAAVPLFAQEAPEVEKPSAEAEAPPALPQAGSEEARKMVEQALAKMTAYARGTFSTTENQDSAMMRQVAGGMLAGQDVDVDGGWHRDLVWGSWDGREFRRGNGRMLAKVGEDWRLRRDKLAGGVPAPFTLDPDYLFAAVAQLPENARRIVHVDEGKVAGRRVVILSMQLEGDDALEFSDCGAVPDAGGGFGQVLMLGGLGGMMEPPRPELTTYLAFHVDAENGDLLRFGSRTYSVDEMAGQIQIAGAGGAFGGDDEEEEEEEEEAEPQGPPKWKRGFPQKKPADDESVTTFRVTFKNLGLAEAPALDAAQKQLLRVR